MAASRRAGEGYADGRAEPTATREGYTDGKAGPTAAVRPEEATSTALSHRQPCLWGAQGQGLRQRPRYKVVSVGSGHRCLRFSCSVVLASFLETIVESNKIYVIKTIMKTCSLLIQICTIL
jgi:hypothetical protein